MKYLIIFTITLLIVSDITVAKKKSKKAKFNSKTLNCLVCQNLVEEFKSEIFKVDPKKVIDTGTFRVDDKGDQKKSIIPFARSQIHLMELVDKICDNFDDYAQGTLKKNGKPTIIRLTTASGNMNSKMGEVDLVPDEDLNTKLKFYCQSIIEAQEEDFTNLFADEKNDDLAKEEICINRSKLCKSVKDEL